MLMQVTAKEKQQRVEGLIEELGLSKCADTKVSGTEGGGLRRSMVSKRRRRR